MDEPFASVDAQSRADLEDLVLTVQRHTELTAVLVTHDIDESVYLADRVLEQMNMPGFGSDLKKDSFEATVQGMLELGFLEEEVTVEQAFYDEST